jgi:hypothetical protein
MKRNGGTVTLFAFDKGQAFSEHTAPFDALVQVRDGEVELVIRRQGSRCQGRPDGPHACTGAARRERDEQIQEVSAQRIASVLKRP